MYIWAYAFNRTKAVKLKRGQVRWRKRGASSGSPWRQEAGKADFCLVIVSQMCNMSCTHHLCLSIQVYRKTFLLRGMCIQVPLAMPSGGKLALGRRWPCASPEAMSCSSPGPNRFRLYLCACSPPAAVEIISNMYSVEALSTEACPDLRYGCLA